MPRQNVLLYLPMTYTYTYIVYIYKKIKRKQGFYWVIADGVQEGMFRKKSETLKTR